jgi:hypothetical protein
MDIAKYANLLAKLAYEDDFRQRFTADPRGTLVAMGINDPEHLPDKVVLPPKETLQKEYEDRLLRIAIRPSMPMAGLL